MAVLGLLVRVGGPLAVRDAVVDLGRDCPVATLVAATAREAASGVLISGLISSIVPQVRRVRPALRTHGLGSVWVVAGGAALKQCAAADIDVDYVAENAFDGARYIEARFTGATP